MLRETLVPSSECRAGTMAVQVFAQSKICGVRRDGCMHGEGRGSRTARQAESVVRTMDGTPEDVHVLNVLYRLNVLNLVLQWAILWMHWRQLQCPLLPQSPHMPESLDSARLVHLVAPQVER
jgi:hypothetical protein